MKYSDFRSHKTFRRTALRYAGPGAFLTLALLLALANVEVPTPLTSAGHDLVRPLWGGTQSLTAAVTAAYETLESKEALVRENMTLHEELSSERRKSFDSELLRLENERLRNLLGRSTRDTRLASVLTSSVSSPYDVFVIDVGTAGGVAAGALVTAEEGSVLGAVRSVFANSSVVSMFTSPGFEVPVMLGATSTVRAIATGRGSGMLEVLLPRDVPVAVGDAVYLQTVEVHRVGSVRSINVSPEDATQKLFIEAAVYLSGVRHVLVHTDTLWEPEVVASSTDVVQVP